jgi:hypothetical protein
MGCRESATAGGGGGVVTTAAVVDTRRRAIWQKGVVASVGPETVYVTIACCVIVGPLKVKVTVFGNVGGDAALRWQKFSGAPAK